MQINYTNIYKITTQFYKSMQHLRHSFVFCCCGCGCVVVALLSQGRCVRNVFVLSWLSSAKIVEEGTRKGPNIKLTEMLRHRAVASQGRRCCSSQPAICVQYLKLKKNTPRDLSF
jgi:hypothetical protein